MCLSLLCHAPCYCSRHCRHYVGLFKAMFNVLLVVVGCFCCLLLLFFIFDGLSSWLLYSVIGVMSVVLTVIVVMIIVFLLLL